MKGERRERYIPTRMLFANRAENGRKTFCGGWNARCSLTRRILIKRGVKLNDSTTIDSHFCSRFISELYTGA